jgi:hypothetical protein
VSWNQIITLAVLHCCLYLCQYPAKESLRRVCSSSFAALHSRGSPHKADSGAAFSAAEGPGTAGTANRRGCQECARAGLGNEPLQPLLLPKPTPKRSRWCETPSLLSFDLSDQTLSICPAILIHYCAMGTGHLRDPRAQMHDREFGPTHYRFPAG